MLRRFLTGAALSALLLTGCGQDQGQDATVEIGAVTIVSHPSLDAIYEGFKEGLAEAGYVEGENLKLDFQNPQGDQQTLANITSTRVKPCGSAGRWKDDLRMVKISSIAAEPRMGRCRKWLPVPLARVRQFGVRRRKVSEESGFGRSRRPEGARRREG